MYDEPVAVPIIDLLDSNMMSQYISAAREQYNQAIQDQKEFAKEFGELYGPNANINKQFYDDTRGAVNKGLDYLYQNGIDPLRSAEGRAYIAKIIRERPYAEIANLKAQNESMKTYQRYRAEAMRNGTYDPDFEKFVLGGKTLRHGIHLQMVCGPEKLHLSILVLRTGQVIYLTICSLSMMMKLLRKLEACIRFTLSQIKR